MQGLLTLAPTYTATAGTRAIDIIGSAQGQLGALGYQVTGTLVNPVDWTAIQQAKAEGSGTYLIGNPGQGATPLFLWNVPLIPSSNIMAGTFLTGAFGPQRSSMTAKCGWRLVWKTATILSPTWRPSWASAGARWCTGVPVASEREFGNYMIEQRAFELLETKADGEGRFSGYASTWSEDLAHDKIPARAFARSIQEKRGKLPLLWQHDPAQWIGF